MTNQYTSLPNDFVEKIKSLRQNPTHLIVEEILSSKWSLQNHKLKKHNDILGIGFQCRKCDYTAKDAKRLKEHESSKHNPKFQCKYSQTNFY